MCRVKQFLRKNESIRLVPCDIQECAQAAKPVGNHKKKDTPTGVFLFGAALLLRKSGRLRAGDLTRKGNPTKVPLAYISSDGLIFATYDHYATFVEIV